MLRIFCYQNLPDVWVQDTSSKWVCFNQLIFLRMWDLFLCSFYSL